MVTVDKQDCSLHHNTLLYTSIPLHDTVYGAHNDLSRVVKMLHWLAGQKQSEGPTDPDATGYIEPPETPAPVFAVRAFKHAIFGTPQTVQQPKPRRNSNNDTARARLQTRFDRPQLTRPKSVGDARLTEDVPEPIFSPTKGILMTPGTAAAKRKTVTFGAHVKPEDNKPQPQIDPAEDDADSLANNAPSHYNMSDDGIPDTTDRVGRRNKLTVALEHARDESGKRSAKTHKRNKSVDEPELPRDLKVSDSGQYWKAQYDSYRENSQREIRKLITKQKSAKTFARDKDDQCNELADELRQERKKVEKLERRMVELQAQLKAMQLELAHSTEVGPSTIDTKPGSAVFTKEVVMAHRHKDATTTAAPHATSDASAKTVKPAHMLVPGTNDVAGQWMARKQPVLKHQEHTETLEAESKKPRSRARLGAARTKTDDDIWDLSVDTSTAPQSRSQERAVAESKTGRYVTSGTGVTPLQTLNINTMPSMGMARRDSAQPSPPTDHFANEPLVRQEVVRTNESKGQETILSNPLPSLPMQSSDKAQDIESHSKSPLNQKPATPDIANDLRIPVPASSPFQPNPMAAPSITVQKKPAYFDHDPHQIKISALTSTKDEQPPATKPRSALTENVKPTAAWNAINAPGAGVRLSSLTDRSGKELDQDRIAAARARLAAKVRGPS
ncbi:hypothetical protein LTR62_005227 [Meristemomyces frigidus]|uniref:Spindle pole body-associated protein cut12 domain-containing protein n=1 Tax=Meristemomyces frigidus TaxID=1508187 RepID=A0AAN7YFH3_9PEZI|nr:hypothetical protein LTR62_005227 [Meristemomyces frigidus]